MVVPPCTAKWWVFSTTMIISGCSRVHSTVLTHSNCKESMKPADSVIADIQPWRNVTDTTDTKIDMTCHDYHKTARDN